MGSVRRDIERILGLETKTDYGSFIDGLTDDSQVEYKYEFACDLIEHVGEGEKKQEAVLEEMINSHALSPEAAAYIVFNNFPNDDKCKNAVGSIYRRVEERYYYDYDSTFLTMQRDILLEYKRIYESRIKLIDFINRTYCDRYGLESCSSKWFAGKCAVYTVITGDYDDIVDPEFVNPEWDYFCFTDKPEKYASKVWNIIDTNEKCGDIELQDKNLINRYVKTHPHTLLSAYDYTIYVDGNIKVIGDFTRYIKAFSRGCSMLAFPHPSRNSITDEAGAIIALNKADPMAIRNQLDKYTKEGYNDYRSLISAGCLVRSNRDELLNKTMEDWWTEIRDASPRDQMSLGYVCWKNNYYFDISNIYIYENEFLKILAHS